jgi:phosphoribosylamine---glycine ligase
VRADDVEGLAELCVALRIDLAVVGPEAPLVVGAGDALRRAGIAVFGPGAAAARIEGSKAYAKDVMQAAGVPTAAVLDEPRAPCVIKADGLAAGKGVFVCQTQAEVEDALPRARSFGDALVIEELLEGEEASILVVTDGTGVAVLPAAQDYKRLGDDDTGPNTGGMGAYSPVPQLPPEAIEEIVDIVH